MEDGSKVFVCCAGTSDVYSIETATNTVSGPFPAGNNPNFLRFNPNDSLVYVANAGSNDITINDAANGALIPPPLSVGLNPDYFAFSIDQVVSRPTNLAVIQETSRFLNQTVYFNILSWTASDSAGVVSYRIYRNASLTFLAGEVPASGPLQFVDAKSPRNEVATYYVTAVGADGAESEPASISISPN